MLLSLSSALPSGNVVELHFLASSCLVEPYGFVVLSAHNLPKQYKLSLQLIKISRNYWFVKKNMQHDKEKKLL